MMIARTLNAWVNRALALVYPDVCQLCLSQWTRPAEGYVCPDCLKAVRHIRTPCCNRCGLPFDGDLTAPFECTNCRELDLEFDSARAAVFARGLVLDVIHRYKYRRAFWFEPFLANLLIRQAAPALNPAEWDLIIPVPLHPVREREREFNQAYRLALSLSKATGIRLCARSLQRVRFTHTQTRLSRKQRLDNMHKAFALRSGAPLHRASCVLVDDVLTTGATTSACARELKAGGARRVCVWTVARGV